MRELGIFLKTTQKTIILKYQCFPLEIFSSAHIEKVYLSKLMTKLKLATVKIDISKLSDPINLDLRCFNISGPAVLCDGVRQRWRPDVPDPAVREVQGASGCVSTNYQH